MSADDGREFELARSRTLARELVEIARSRALAWELAMCRRAGPRSRRRVTRLVSLAR
jgi:hypothetical protein